jgi:HEAT repeats
VIGSSVLTWIAVGFGGASLVALAAWLAHAAWQTSSDARFARRRPELLRMVATALHGRSTAQTEIALAGVSDDQRIDVLVDMSFTVAGEQRGELNRLAHRIGVIERASRWSHSSRWSRRLRSARLLTLFGDGTEPEGLELLRDRRPEVRAQATEWAAAHPASERLEALLSMLADPDPGCRFAARDGLRRAGRAAIDPLRRFLEWTSGPPAAGALEAAQGVATPDLLPAALRLARADDPAVRLRAVSLTGAVGGPAAAETLVAALDDGDPAVRAAAAQGLGSLGHWRAAARLGGLLGDDRFAVRSAAASALLRMGPTGELMLRRAGRDDDPRIRDIARNVLLIEPEVPDAEPQDAARLAQTARALA